jgi:hypothetical protein
MLAPHRLIREGVAAGEHGPQFARPALRQYIHVGVEERVHTRHVQVDLPECRVELSPRGRIAGTRQQAVGRRLRPRRQQRRRGIELHLDNRPLAFGDVLFAREVHELFQAGQAANAEQQRVCPPTQFIAACSHRRVPLSP